MRVAVDWLPVVPEGPSENEEQYEAAGCRHDSLHEEVAQVAREVSPVIPGAGEPGETVVESDHHTERVH